MEAVTVRRGAGPIVLGLPHVGTWVPDEIAARLNDTGRLLADTDWHVDRLYDGLLPAATTVRANFHRYVIDPNRDPSGESLYPGQATTDLVPTTDFDGNPIWRDGMAPDLAERTDRLALYHARYHQALNEELTRVREHHGVAILYDCHSIRSRIPRLFEGRLPDFNIGDNKGTTCHPAISEAVVAVCADAAGYTHVHNGRFKGGWTTRNYGLPHLGVHAIQMELAQSTHLAAEVPPFDYDADKAETLRTVLKRILDRLEALALSGNLS